MQGRPSTRRTPLNRKDLRKLTVRPPRRQRTHGMPLNYLRSSTLSAMRTYRIEVIGQFDRPQGVVRERLLARAPHHGLITSAFTPEGTFRYNASLTRFTFKYLVTSDADSAVAADASAAEEAELKALAHLEEHEIPFRSLTTSSTCVDDIKPRRGR